ncbi:MAG: type VI secretion system baseplate subunit TssG, partial [Planctomycetota bacterium]
MSLAFNQSHPRMIRLRRQSRDYSFFQAMRDIESVADVYPRLGQASSPTQEAVRIAQSPELDFAPTAIE